MCSITQVLLANIIICIWQKARKISLLMFPSHCFSSCLLQVVLVSAFGDSSLHLRVCRHLHTHVSQGSPLSSSPYHSHYFPVTSLPSPSGAPDFQTRPFKKHPQYNMARLSPILLTAMGLALRWRLWALCSPPHHKRMRIEELTEYWEANCRQLENSLVSESFKAQLWESPEKQVRNTARSALDTLPYSTWQTSCSRKLSAVRSHSLRTWALSHVLLCFSVLHNGLHPLQLSLLLLSRLGGLDITLINHPPIPAVRLNPFFIQCSSFPISSVSQFFYYWISLLNHYLHI